MFFGQSIVPIDPDNQVALPGNLAVSLSRQVYLTQGFDRNLLLFPEGAFKFLYDQMLSMNLADPRARLLLRMILGTAVAATLGPTGELDLPAVLKDFARLGDQAAIIGQGSFIEIWDPEQWSPKEMSYQDVEADPERYASFSITFA